MLNDLENNPPHLQILRINGEKFLICLKCMDLLYFRLSYRNGPRFWNGSNCQWKQIKNFKTRASIFLPIFFFQSHIFLTLNIATPSITRKFLQAFQLGMVNRRMNHYSNIKKYFAIHIHQPFHIKPNPYQPDHSNQTQTQATAITSNHNHRALFDKFPSRENVAFATKFCICNTQIWNT